MEEATAKSKTNPRNLRPAVGKPKKKAQVKPNSADMSGVGQVIMRNEFYRDGYRLALRVAVAQSIIIIGLIAAMFYVINIHQPENRYFATTEDGRLIPMTSLREPNLSKPALLSWVAQAVTEVMTFGHHDYQRRLQEASRNFTRDGWESFTSAMQSARVIDSVLEYEQVVSAAPRAAPELYSEGLVNGQYQWILRVPMTVTYQSKSKSKSDNFIVTVSVVRVPRLESPNGVGIAQWIAQPG